MLARVCAVMLLAGFVSACNDKAPDSANNKLGADKDIHGCIASAGYQWCARTGDCQRPWELAEQEGFNNTPQAFSDFCGG